MNVRDGAIVGARLLAIFFVAQALNALQEFATLALQDAPASAYSSDLAGALIFGLAAAWMWIQAPMLADTIVAGTRGAQESPTPVDPATRTILIIGLSIAGLFLAGTAIQPLVGNLWRVIDPSATFRGAEPLEGQLRKEAAAFTVAALAKLAFGILLFRRARDIAARAKL